MASRKLNWKSKLGSSSVNPHSALDGMNEIQREMGIVNVVSEAEGGFTVNDYAEKYRLPLDTASAQVKKMLDQGKIECIGRRLGGKKVYRIVNVKKSH